MTILRTRYILAFWAPLAATWLMMGLEGPYITAIVARLPDAAFNLAAYGIAFSIALIVEAPIMMMLTASNALVRSRESLRALRRFTYALNAILTVVLVIVVLPPVFGGLADLMNLPDDIARLAHWTIVVVLPWPAAIGYRRFYQGILVRAGLTRLVPLRHRSSPGCDVDCGGDAGVVVAPAGRSNRRRVALGRCRGGGGSQPLDVVARHPDTRGHRAGRRKPTECPAR